MSDQASKESRQYSSREVEMPILAIDFGERRIGLAVSDSKGIVSTPLQVVQVPKSNNLDGSVEEIVKIADEYRVKTFLIGLPQAFEISHENVREKIKIFADKLAQQSDLPIIFYDESFSTSNAQNMLLSLGQRSKSSKHKIDMVSAALFLQEYLDANRNHEL